MKMGGKGAWERSQLSKKWKFTKESTEEGAKHRIREGGEEGAELPDHAQGQHEGGPVLYHPSTANLWDTPEAEKGVHLKSSMNSPGPLVTSVTKS